MPRHKRVQLLKAIEGIRNSHVISYICGDRVGAAAQIGDDAIRPMYDLLRGIGQVDKVDLFLYSRGGAVEVPWRIVTMLREHGKSVGVLIPFRAHSAATLISLGGDEIVMGSKAELGPIDPAINRITQDSGTPVQEEIRVEDVMSYVGFLRDKAGLGDQSALAQNITLLAQKLSPWVLGSIYRTHSHIRMVARRMLASHKVRIDEQKMNLIVESLAEKIYLHGHAIGRSEAEELGLNVVRPTEELEKAMWELLEDYEQTMNLRHPVDAEALLGNNDNYSETVTIAMLESSSMVWAFRGDLTLRKIRQAPGQVNIGLNLNVALPPGIPQNLIPQEVVQQLVQQVQNDVPHIVQEQVKNQSPVLRVQGRIQDGYWRNVTSEESGQPAEEGAAAETTAAEVLPPAAASEVQ